MLPHISDDQFSRPSQLLNVSSRAEHSGQQLGIEKSMTCGSRYIAVPNVIHLGSL
jgi:hypothetical protein